MHNIVKIEEELEDCLALWRLYRRGYFDTKVIWDRFKVQFEETALKIEDWEKIGVPRS